jgi:hypothetical protein
MRRFILGTAIVLAISLFVGVPAGADYYDYELSGDAAPQVGIEYTVGSGVGELTILGGAGLSLEAYDAAGAPIAATVIFDTVQSVSVPAAGDASVLYVRVGDTWYELSTNDPDWGLD